MNVKQKLSDLLSRYRQRRTTHRKSYQKARAEYYKGSKGHHPCEALATATKNTRPNRWNIRPKKSRRPESRFAKLAAFKLRYGLA